MPSAPSFPALRPAILPLLLLCLVCAGGAAPSGGMYELKLRLEAGQRFAFVGDERMSFAVDTHVNGKPDDRLERGVTRRVAGAREILDVAGGVPTAVRLTFDPGCVETTRRKGHAEESKPLAYAGKTVTIRRGPDGRVAHDLAGEVDPEADEDLRQMLDPDGVHLPDKPVAVGDSWEASDRVARHIGARDGEQVAVHCKLVAVKSVGGREVAEVTVSGAFIKVEGFVELATEVEGTLLIDVQTGRTVKSNLRGTLAADGAHQAVGPDGKPVDVKVSGTGTLEQTETTEPAPTTRPNG